MSTTRNSLQNEVGAAFVQQHRSDVTGVLQQLRKDFREFQRTGDVKILIKNIKDLRQVTQSEALAKEAPGRTQKLTREDLRLICFDLLTAG